MTHTNRETVVGVFLDQSYAQRALQALQSAGYTARIADSSALNSLNLPQNEAGIYTNRMSEGNVVVIVDNAGNQGEDVLNMLLQYGAEYMNLHAGQQGATQTQGSAQYDEDYYRNLRAEERQYGTVDTNRGRARNAEELRVELREETLGAVKQAGQAGEVEVRKVVHEREQQVPVTLRHEEVTIERHAVDRPVTGEITDMQDEVIRVPVYEETAELQKQARVREEVVIGKEAHQEQQTLAGTTRHEHLEVVETGDVRVTGDADMQTRTTQSDTDTNMGRQNR